MFFLKKMVARCFFPVPLVLELILLGAVLLRWKRSRRVGAGLMSLGVGLLVVLSLPVVGSALLAPLERAFVPFELCALSFSPVEPVVIAVAGSGFDGGRFNDHFLVRLQEAGRIAVALLREGVSCRVVVSVSGDAVSASDKRAALVHYFAAFGLSAEAVDLVGDARNSVEEVAAFGRVSGGSFILVSQAFHLSRLMRICERAGVSAIPAPAGAMVMERPMTVLDWIPSGEALMMSHRAFYERLGLVSLSLSGREEGRLR